MIVKFIRYLDIRFDPTSIGSSVPPNAPNPPRPIATVANEKADLSDKHLNAWAALFNEVYPSASEMQARKSVDGMFPDKRVTVARLRRVLPDRAPGRPRKNQDK
jgi:hypothetical protein